MRICVQLIQNHKIARETVVNAAGSKKAQLMSALNEGCEAFELSRPIVMKKHENEWRSFSRTAFLPDDFVGEGGFDRLVVEIIADKKKK